MDELQPFTYLPLADKQIRVFYLQPGSGQLITGKLRSQDFDGETGDSYPNYAALSYAWGRTYHDGSHLTHAIVCDGCRIAVTATLHQALTRLREVTPGKLGGRKASKSLGFALWIDYLCIDQGNVAERSSQVEKMYWIYMRATKVIIWLGEPSEGPLGSSESRMIEAVASNKIVDTYWSEEDEESIASTSIMSRSWFQRRWCVQETHISTQEYIMMLGKATCNPVDFARVFGRTFPIALARFNEGLKKDETFMQALYAFEDTECSDPRDRVYALCSLHSTSMRVDYSLNVRDTYLHAALVTAFGDNTDPRELRQRVSGSGATIIFPEVRLLELLRLLVLASRPIAVAESGLAPSQPEMERWCSDWTAQSSHDGSQHMAAVDYIVHADLRLSPEAAIHSLPHRMTISPEQHCYLQVEGTIVRNSTYDPSVYDPSRKDVSIILSAMRQADIFWLAYMLCWPRREDPECWSSLTTFVLRPGQTRSSYEGCPVYRLHSCFRLTSEQIYCETFDDLCEDFVKWTSGEIEHGAEFLLE